MSDTSSILLVAATERELCGHPGLVCGIGPVEAATTTARALAERLPAAVLHVGIAGGSGLEPGTMVVGTGAVYCDLAADIAVVSRVSPDAELLSAARRALPGSQATTIGTTAAVGGPCGSEPHGLLVEAMEGFAVLRACELARVPAVEVRAISNEIGVEDRARWEVPRALDALAHAIPRLLAAAAD